MAESIGRIILHKETHAIEVANFIVALGHKIDIGDIHRFEEQREHLGSLFQSIRTPDVYKFKLGDPLSRTVRQDGSALHRELAYFGELHAKVRKWRAELGKCRAGSGNVWICRQNRHGVLHHQRTFIYNHWESRSKHISCALSHVIPLFWTRWQS